MRKAVLLTVTIAALVFAIGASASASKPWYLHTAGKSGHYVCNRDSHNPLGTFATKAACKAAIPTDNGGGGESTPPAGWPGTSGTLSGDASGGCNGEAVILTSQDDENGYGAFDFDIVAGRTFAQTPLTFDIAVLSGTQAQSEPYMIVRFSDHTQAFVYSVEVNGVGTGTYYSTLAGNQYITYDQALEAYGDKIVSSVTLAVDNGNLSIAAYGLTNDACPTPVVTPRTPDGVFLCYSSFQTVPGVWVKDQAVALIAEGYTEAQAVAGNVEGGANVGAYHLVCNSGLRPNGQFVGDGGFVYGSDYGPATEELGFYPIFA